MLRLTFPRWRNQVPRSGQGTSMNGEIGKIYSILVENHEAKRPAAIHWSTSKHEVHTDLKTDTLEDELDSAGSV